MNVHYGKLFKYPRKVWKYFLSAIYPIIIRVYPLPMVKSIPETIDKILAEKCSICRFGDGELLYISERRSLPFQKQDERLRKYFITILNSEHENLLIGLPIGFYSLSNLKKSTYHTWRAIISWTYPGIKKYLKKDKIYYNASMTRPYIEYQDKSHCKEWFDSIRKIWENRSIILIEGEKSRLGVGNDLFNEAKSVKRILGPAHNAFDRYDSILEYAKKQPKDSLILIAMGPTAKPLAYELAKNGYQAIDIGNIDIEYEWFLRGANEKVKIIGKYTSEAVGGRDVSEINDKTYNSQIIMHFRNGK